MWTGAGRADSSVQGVVVKSHAAMHLVIFFFFLLGPGSASLRYRVGQANGRANEVGVAGRWAARQSPRAQTMMASSAPHPVPATQQPPRHGSIRGRAGGLSKTGVSGLRRTGLAPRVIGTYPLPQDDVVRVGRRGVGDGSLAVPRPINLDRLDASPTSPVPARRRGRQKQEFGVGAVSSEFSLGQWCQHWARWMNKAMGHKGHLQNILDPDMERALPNPWRKETNPASCTERDQAKRAIVSGLGRRGWGRRECFGAQRASWGGVHRPSWRSWTIVDLDLGIGAFYLSETVATLLDLNYHIGIVLAWPSSNLRRWSWEDGSPKINMANAGRGGVGQPVSPAWRRRKKLRGLGAHVPKFSRRKLCQVFLPHQNSSTWIQLRCASFPFRPGGPGLSALPGSRTPFRAFLFFSFVFFVRLKNPSSRSTSSPPRLSRPTPGAAAPLTMASGSSGPRIGSAGSTGPQQQPRAILLPTITTQDSRRQGGQAKHGKLDCQVSGQPDRSSSRGGDPSASHPNPHDMDIGRR